jgi:hypothetical protein
MSRLELELYADASPATPRRLRDDIDGARLRIAWSGIEAVARAELGRPRRPPCSRRSARSSSRTRLTERRLLERRLQPARVASSGSRRSSSS